MESVTKLDSKGSRPLRKDYHVVNVAYQSNSISRLSEIELTKLQFDKRLFEIELTRLQSTHPIIIFK